MKDAQALYAKSRIISGVYEVAAVLAVSVFLPFAIHFLPIANGGVPAGAVWLPIFYAPFVAIMFARPYVGMIGGILAPLVNYLVTGMPRPEMLFPLSIELFFFAAFSSYIFSKHKEFIGNALVSYLLAKLLLSVVSGAPQAFMDSLGVSLPGMAVLFFLNFVLVRFKKGRDAENRDERDIFQVR